MRTTKLVATILSCKFECLRAFSVNHQLNCDLTHPYLDAKLSCPPWQGMTTKFGSLIIYVVCLNWWYLSCFQDFLVCFCKTFIFCSYLSFSVSFSLMMIQNISEFVSIVTSLHFDFTSFWHFWINKWIWIKIIM